MPVAKPTKLVVYCQLWPKPKFFAELKYPRDLQHPGDKRMPFAKLEDAREFARKHGYSGIKGQFV